ncbi:Imm63 family immunity protein [Kitasatospora sp. NPDC096147]|uniref:Imm63 family immunity protein n=1 Tax=Kitasatospora sp. NPDC096147 TaxID=3364093 RepID=UPI00381A96C6
MTTTLEDIRTAVHALAARLPGAGRAELVGFHPRDGAHPYVEVHGRTLHWVLVDQGRELRRRTTTSLDELLYWITLDATGPPARRREREQRGRLPADRDPGIGRLAHQLDLLRGLDPRWAARFRAELPTLHPGVSAADVDAHPLG